MTELYIRLERKNDNLASVFRAKLTFKCQSKFVLLVAVQLTPFYQKCTEIYCFHILIWIMNFM